MASHINSINQHLALEFQASHTYLAMSIWLREKDLHGFSSYMLNKSTEERGHASRMIAYLVDSDAVFVGVDLLILLVLVHHFNNFVSYCCKS